MKYLDCDLKVLKDSFSKSLTKVTLNNKEKAIYLIMHSYFGMSVLFEPNDYNLSLTQKAIKALIKENIDYDIYTKLFDLAYECLISESQLDEYVDNKHLALTILSPVAYIAYEDYIRFEGDLISFREEMKKHLEDISNGFDLYRILRNCDNLIRNHMMLAGIRDPKFKTVLERTKLYEIIKY